MLICDVLCLCIYLLVDLPDRLWYNTFEESMKVDISLFPFTEHIVTLVDGRFKALGAGCEVIALH